MVLEADRCTHNVLQTADAIQAVLVFLLVPVPAEHTTNELMS